METWQPRSCRPSIPGHTDFDLYPNGPDHKGDLDAAKKSLEACGQPNGFETNIAYRPERPKEKATAEAFQQALSRVGIMLTLKPYPLADYFAQYCGLPPFVVKNKLGLCINSWAERLARWFRLPVRRSSTRGSSGRPAVPPIPASASLRSIRCSTRRLTELDTDKRNQMWGEIDKRVMEEAVIYPGVYAKLLFVRSKNATNIFVTTRSAGTTTWGWGPRSRSKTITALARPHAGPEHDHLRR